jgi:hypothetical protein
MNTTESIFSMRFFRSVLTLALVGMLAWGCASSETTQTASKTSGKSGKTESKKEQQIDRENMSMLDRYRSDLSDPYARRTQDMPEAFEWRPPEKSGEEAIDNEGYRVQIASTRNVAIADSISSQFRQWMAVLGTDYQPNTYIIFRQPYYRVHVGDFHQREPAIDFSRMVKRRYPDAWVVHDRINPNEVPADSSLQKLLKRPFEIRDAARNNE